MNADGPNSEPLHGNSNAPVIDRAAANDEVPSNPQAAEAQFRFGMSPGELSLMVRRKFRLLDAGHEAAAELVRELGSGHELRWIPSASKPDALSAAQGKESPLADSPGELSQHLLAALFGSWPPIEGPTLPHQVTSKKTT